MLGSALYLSVVFALHSTVNKLNSGFLEDLPFLGTRVLETVIQILPEMF